MNTAFVGKLVIGWESQLIHTYWPTLVFLAVIAAYVTLVLARRDRRYQEAMRRECDGCPAGPGEPCSTECSSNWK